MKPQQRLTDLVIDGVDDEGRGRAVHAGWDIAVRGAFPGDVVSVAVVEEVWPQRQLAQARRLDPLRGPLHTERLCGHNGPCAACPLHGVDDGFRNALLRERVRVAFADAGLGVDVVVVDEVVAGEGARQKIKLVVAGEPGALRVGHFVPHTHNLAPALFCGVVRDRITDVVERVVFGLNESDEDHGVKAVIAREFVEGVGVVVVASGDVIAGLREFAGADCIGVAWRRDERGGNSLVGGSVVDVDGVVVGTPLDGGPACHVDAFCQADVEGAAALVDRAAEFVVGVDAGASFFDLYAGTGAFARALINRGAAGVTAVEVFDKSVSALARIDGVTAVAGRVADVIDVLQKRPPPRGIVVDPPRQGLGADAKAIASFGADRIALVSCDVDNGAKDAAALVGAGYRVEAVIPVDLFPGSAEVEVLTLLRRA